jgi:hypothetical protein
MNDLLDTMCTCKITNIKCTSSEPILFFTQYVSSTSFYLITLYDAQYVGENLSSGFFTVFIQDESENLYPYSLERSHQRTNIYKLGWSSPIPLKCSLQLGFIDSSNHSYENEKCLIHISLPEIIGKNQFHIITNLLEQKSLLFLDNVCCNILTHGENNFDTIAHRLNAKWINVPGIETNEIEPLIAKMPNEVSACDIDEKDCLLYDQTCTLGSGMYELPDSNRLDAIVVTASHFEVLDGRLESFLQHLLQTLQGYSTIDKHFYICLNKSVVIPPTLDAVLDTCKSKFTMLQLVNLQIPHEHDIYIKNYKTMTRPFPKYGNASGPNCMFFGIMRKLTHYNTILQLETDCRLKGDWLARCENYVSYSGRFLIAGAFYDGKGIGGTFLNTHLNGVGFYKTGSALFQKLLDFLELNIIRNAQFGRLESGYDYTLRVCVNQYLDQYQQTPHFYMFWRYIHRLLVQTTLIVNISTNSDSDIPLDYIDRLYDCVIIHRKDR